MSLDANTAASSAAPTPAAEPGNFLSTLSREQYDTWSRTGAIPDTTPTETPKADPSPAPPDTPAPETPHAADSSPATPEKRTDPRAEENRIPKLLEERARERERADRLERELADLRRQVTPPKETPTADSSPAPAAPPKASVAYPPALGSYDAYLAANPESSYEDYQDARTDFRVTETLKAERAAEQQRTAQVQREESRTTAQRERNAAFQKQIEAAKQADPTFLDSLSEDVKGLKPFDALVRDRPTSSPARWCAGIFAPTSVRPTPAISPDGAHR
jgi:hypothetical protein